MATRTAAVTSPSSRGAWDPINRSLSLCRTDFGATAVPPTLEAMASDRFAAVLSAQPEGPYRVAGYCVGGLIAFEVARMLVASGRQVDLVAMIDPPTLNALPAVQRLLSFLNYARRANSTLVDAAIARIWFFLAKAEQFFAMSPGERWNRGAARAAETLRSALSRFSVAEPAAPTEPRSRGAFLPHDEFIRIYSHAMSCYRPAPLAVPVVYFRAEYNGEAWRRISSELEVVALTGRHHAVTIDPAEVADGLGAKLQNAVG